MKFFVVAFSLFVVANAALTPKVGAEYEQIRIFCIEKEGVTGDNLVSLQNFQYPDVLPVRCYMKCMALNLTLWNHGLIQDRVIAQFKLNRSKASMKPGVAKCIKDNRDKPDQCTWIYREFKCMIDQGLLDEEAILKS